MIEAKLFLNIPKEVKEALSIDNYKEKDFLFEVNDEIHIKTKNIGSLKATLDDFFRCLDVALKTYQLIIKIRKVKPEDLETFLELYYKAYRGFDKYYYKKKRWAKWYFKWLMKRDEDGFLVLEYCNKPIGFIGVDCNWVSNIEKREVAEIHEIFVDPDYRGRGFGKLLINKAIEYAKKRGRDFIELWVGVENKEGQKFYERLGFKKDVIIKDWLRMYKVIE
ncbi:KEOPS complex subunit Pcc1 [Methanocaldococcus infernus]|nr:KEOPS complex subunit Pcc1 [Methanocaldococcus infernus]